MCTPLSTPNLLLIADQKTETGSYAEFWLTVRHQYVIICAKYNKAQRDRGLPHIDGTIRQTTRRLARIGGVSLFDKSFTFFLFPIRFTIYLDKDISNLRLAALIPEGVLPRHILLKMLP